MSRLHLVEAGTEIVAPHDVAARTVDCVTQSVLGLRERIQSQLDVSSGTEISHCGGSIHHRSLRGASEPSSTSSGPKPSPSGSSFLPSGDRNARQVYVVEQGARRARTEQLPSFNMGQPSRFAWTQRKNGDVVISHNGRQASVLRNAKAEQFVADVGFDDAQELMARLTGNYKHGNERQASNHPRNRRASDLPEYVSRSPSVAVRVRMVGFLP
jgi:hypothetical protein